MSPFLQIPPSKWLAQNDLAFAIPDGFPVSPGHALVITRRQVATWADATRDEQLAVMDLVEVVRAQIQAERSPDGFNVGFNLGRAAGQTVMHLHVHVIPRWDGDVDDPRGGVRFVIPGKGNYLRPGHVPSSVRLSRGGDDAFLHHLAPLIGRAQSIDILAAFAMTTGVDLVAARLESALARGASVRVLTGDYLNLTQADALRTLLDLADRWDGLQTRVVEVDRLPGSRSFHPKAWILHGTDGTTAFVGSSNLSRSALTDGVEWNLQAESAAAQREISTAFGDLWDIGRPLTAEWLDDYAIRAARTQRPLPIDVPVDAQGPATPRIPVQSEALKALAKVRAEGRDRAIVALATGMGKTWLAAFDVDQVRQADGRVPRTLVVAHRRELLFQAAKTFRRLFPQERFGWFVEKHAERTGDLIFASVQKLRGHLDRFAPDTFDYIVVDEAHHAAADSYLALFEHFTPRFWLGLTATPERADSRSIFGLFHDEVAYEADLGVGISLGDLVPFAYFGLTDTTDYAPIPWKNGRFGLSELESAIQTQARMETLWKAWEAHPGSRTLVFCCTIDHARFVQRWLAAKGQRVVSVHSAPDSADRALSLDRLQAGKLDAICTVDLFNEGIDAPMIDRVVMLRPTESSVVFLQQLGRGLRTAPGKERLVVIDFVGNHQVFLDRVRTLLNLVGTGAPPDFRELSKGPVQLPDGCSVQVELEAVELLLKLLPSGQSHVLVRTYRELRAARGERPSAGELSRMGLSPSANAVQRAHGHWLGFVASEGDLDTDEQRVLARHEAWFAELGRTAMTKSFKMVTLHALLDADALTTGMDLGALAQACHALIVRSPELHVDIRGVKALVNPMRPDPTAWARYWRDNPVRAWGRGAFFDASGGGLRLRASVADSDVVAFVRLTRELVDWRLHAYRKRRGDQDPGAAFVCKLITNKRDPILKLPNRERFPGVPTGEVDVRLGDGAWWRFRFVKHFVNVARPVGTQTNKLPDLLRSWFGLDAGRPGTEHRVRFVPSTAGWVLERADAPANVVYPRFGQVLAFPDIQVAAGFHPRSRGPDAVEQAAVSLPGNHASESWAARASGSSMDGGREPIRDGDWMVFTWARSASVADLDGRVVCLERGTDDDATVHVKRIVRSADGVLLRSDNPQVPDVPALPGDRPVALLRAVVRPEQMAPGRLASGPLSELFPWVDAAGDPGFERHAGHLFILLDAPGQALSPCLLEMGVHGWRGETAFVCHRVEGGWRHLGVGRSVDGRTWTVPEMDFRAWSVLRASGNRTGLSRELPEGAPDRAESFASGLLVGTVVRFDGTQLTVLGRTSRGGVRIEDPGRVKPRSVSLTDLAWVLLAEADADVLDQDRVHRGRYIEGTPRASTRWLDTGYAIHLVRGSRGTVG